MKEIIVLFCVVAIVASQRTCGTNEYMENEYRQDPTLKQRRLEGSLLANSQNSSGTDNKQTVYTIPVVVHVVWNVDAQNVPDAVILDQIARLNIDYRKLNKDQNLVVPNFQNLIADSNIQFIFATEDPLGNPTTGITRTKTTVIRFPGPGQSGFNNGCQYSARGGQDIWNRNEYMNIWICNIGGGVLGYAQNPGGNANTDGIVINTEAFGAVGTPPYNKGRTLTHEVGHWLNLEHPWGDNEGDCTEDDNVADTPQTIGPNYNCMLTSNTCANLNMVQNYMDYSNDNCMHLFTPLQATRMRNELTGAGRRTQLNIPNYNGEVLGMNGYISPFDEVSSSIISSVPFYGLLIVLSIYLF